MKINNLGLDCTVREASVELCKKKEEIVTKYVGKLWINHHYTPTNSNQIKTVLHHSNLPAHKLRRLKPHKKTHMQNGYSTSQSPF